MSKVLSDEVLDQLFRQARTHNAWLDEPVTDGELRQIYDLMKVGADQRQLHSGSFRFSRAASIGRSTGGFRRRAFPPRIRSFRPPSAGSWAPRARHRPAPESSAHELRRPLPARSERRSGW